MVMQFLKEKKHNHHNQPEASFLLGKVLQEWGTQ
jgi:hypothetical protein